MDYQTRFRHRFAKGLFSNLPKGGFYGCGQAMAIHRDLMKLLGGKYPISYCDDGYVGAFAMAHGCMKYREIKSYSSETSKTRVFASETKTRVFAYGIEKYKWGCPFWYILYCCHTLLFDKYFVYEVSGWLWAFFHRVKKYDFANKYPHGLVRWKIQRLIAKWDHIKSRIF